MGSACEKNAKMTNTLFDLSEDDLISMLSDMDFNMIGHGHWAYVFGDTDNTVVIKVFPPLNIGTSEELSFIKKNPLLRFADKMSLKWQNISWVNSLRQKAKFVLAIFRSSKNSKKLQDKSDLCVQGYERCISNGLMERFPTRVIPNCCVQLSLKTNRVLKNYLEQPKKIILQKRFKDNELLLNVIKICAERNDIEKCRRYIKMAIDYQVNMWRLGLVSTDMSFNIFENVIVLPDNDLQLHDANDVVNSQSPALWFIREKEKDMAAIFSRLNHGLYPDLLFGVDHGSVSETARKLYNILPKGNRDEVVMNYMDLSQKVLMESVFRKNWKMVPHSDH